MRARPRDASPANHGTASLRFTNHGMARSAIFPTIFTTTPRRAFWPRRGTWHISKSRKAATTLARSVLFPSLRGQFRSRRFESVVAEAERLAAKRRPRNHSDRPGHHLLRRRLRPQRWPCAVAGETRRHRRSALVRFLYAYPNKITGRFWTRSRATKRSVPTWTCPCSTPRHPC